MSCIFCHIFGQCLLGGCWFCRHKQTPDNNPEDVSREDPSAVPMEMTTFQEKDALEAEKLSNNNNLEDAFASIKKTKPPPPKPNVVFTRSDDSLQNDSPKLQAMLLELWDPERKDSLEKLFIHPDIIDDLQSFFNIGSVTITLDNAQYLFMACHHLDIPDLKDATEEFLTKELQFSISNAFEWFRFTAIFRLDTLRERCSRFIYDHFEPIVKTILLRNLSQNSLLQLFTDLRERPSDMIINEAMIQLTIRWAIHDPTARSNDLVTLLTALPLLEVSEKFLRAVIKENVIVNEPAAIELITKALGELSAESQTSSETSHNLYCLGTKRPPYDSVYHLKLSSQNGRYSGHWNKLSSMASRIEQSFSIAQVGNKIYCFGGFHSGRNTNTAQVFDTATNRWTLLRPMPAGRNCSPAVAHNGYIYVSGGYNECSIPTSDVYRYCIATNEWDLVAPMLEARIGHKLVLFKDSIYAIGGVRSIEKYSPEWDTWKMTIRDEDILKFWINDVAVHKEMIYIFTSRHIEIYNPEKNVMDVKDLPKDYFCSSVASIGDKILVTHYTNYSRYFNKGSIHVHEYEPETDEWNQLASLVPLACFRAVVIKR